VSGRDPIAELATELSPRARAARPALYVALGDSFTAGTGCRPGEAWPERLAASIAGGPQLRNLAEHGADSAAVAAQLPEALELEPDLVTVVCGANDVLGSVRPDRAAYGRRLAEVLSRLADAIPEVRIVTATAPERWSFLELGPRTRARVEQGIAAFNRTTRDVATRHGVPWLEVAGHPGLGEADNFSADGLHPSAVGHRRAARGFAELLAASCDIEIEPTPRRST
jgi:phosphatidylinositol alpha 1,6-mannosyltransferase